jgi:hypothetical protein
MSIPAHIKRKGGAASLHKLSVSIEQYDWLVKQLARRIHLGKVTGVNKKNPKLYGIFEDLQDRLTFAELSKDGLATEGAVLSTTRQELRVLGDVVAKQVQALKDKVLPAYARKKEAADKVGGQVTYGPRMLEASGLLRSLTQLSDQIENVYEAGSKRRDSDYGKRGRRS